MKTKEELNAIREEIAGLTTKLKELSDAELEEVSGGLPIIATSCAVLCSFIAGKRPETGSSAKYSGRNFM